jgi:hypothetical protein
LQYGPRFARSVIHLSPASDAKQDAGRTFDFRRAVGHSLRAPFFVDRPRQERANFAVLATKKRRQPEFLRESLHFGPCSRRQVLD